MKLQVMVVDNFGEYEQKLLLGEVDKKTGLVFTIDVTYDSPSEIAEQHKEMTEYYKQLAEKPEIGSFVQWLWQELDQRYYQLVQAHQMGLRSEHWGFRKLVDGVAVGKYHHWCHCSNHISTVADNG
jgi:hypothetical protein